MSSSRSTILLAEDEPNDVFLMRRAFRKAQLMNPLQVVRDGAEAIAYLSGDGAFENRDEYSLPALLLLDLKLPRKTGFEVLEWIRSRPNSLKRLPVIVLSSSRQTIDVNRAYDLGANSYFVKPFDFETLLEMVRTLERFWLNHAQMPEVSSPERRKTCFV